MTNEDAIKILESEWKCIDRNDGINCDRNCENCDLVMDASLIKDAYNTAIKALEQQPCEDCISRAEVENITWEEPSYTDALNAITEIREKVRKLPSVTPMQKEGKWMLEEVKDEDGRPYDLKYYCSECGAERPPIWDEYCSSCGAKMEVQK